MERTVSALALDNHILFVKYRRERKPLTAANIERSILRLYSLKSAILQCSFHLFTRSRQI